MIFSGVYIIIIILFYFLVVILGLPQLVGSNHIGQLRSALYNYYLAVERSKVAVIRGDIHRD
jgi:hypothetical protein